MDGQESRVLVIYTGGTIGIRDFTIHNRILYSQTPVLYKALETGAVIAVEHLRKWNPLLDSSNVEMDDWVRIATEIELNYATFDAFLVLHGTDTMAYTSSALSFMLEDIGKTVDLENVLIRSERICQPKFPPPRGRIDHLSQSALKFPSTGTMCSVKQMNAASERTKVNLNEMNPHVANLRLFPGISAATIKAFFMPPIRGVILETFGAGNAPQRTDLLDALKAACDRGVVVVAITQCEKGAVSDTYETGRTLLQAGVVPGNDMTPECALTKLSYLLSKPELSTADVRDLMTTSLRGELTRHTRSAPSNPTSVEKTLESIQGVLSEFVRLTQPPTPGPQITLTPDPPIETGARVATAPWTWTVGEAALTEAVLIPFLIHIAAARDDIVTIRFCIDTYGGRDGTEEPHKTLSVAGGVVNCSDPANGQTPLHVASLNGAMQAVDLLLRSGALVHVRDSLGHTPLYYAARQCHEEIVDLLVQTGSTLGGADEPFAALGFKNAVLAGHQTAQKIWQKAGVPVIDEER
ncbi:hypothetical protein H0H93_012278 [Arthromyces matolae]|nr:hypothetical protein H0H93_012278 [Arthromyces matolae]